jgi:hypothetical protein
MPRMLRAFVSMLCIACFAGAAVAEQPRTRVGFAPDGIGAVPSDFVFDQTGPGGDGQWAVVRDPTAVAGAAMEQSSADTTDDRYPLAIYQPVSVKNLDLSARVKIVRGRMQSAGIALRLASARNYYLVRVSALEQRVDFIKFIDGRSERIAGADADVLRDRWHTIGIHADDERFIVALDGAPLFTAFDRAFSRAGRVALWTEEDNVTRFDEIEIAALPFSSGD